MTEINLDKLEISIFTSYLKAWKNANKGLAGVGRGAEGFGGCREGICTLNKLVQSNFSVAGRAINRMPFCYTLNGNCVHKLPYSDVHLGDFYARHG